MFGGVGGTGDVADARQNLEGGVSFKFNFSVGDDGGGSGEEKVEEEVKDKRHQDRRGEASTTSKTTAPAFEVFPESFDLSELQLDAVDVGLSSGPILKVRPRQPSASSPSLAHSDLVPGVYEGGFKLWEGAVDLARLLVSAAATKKDDGDGDGAAPTAKTSPSLSFVPLDKHSPRWLPDAQGEVPSFLRSLLGESRESIRILELGCGSALPSLVAAKIMTTTAATAAAENKPSLSVTLCDFNAEVLESCTARNVAATFREEEANGEVSFSYFAGDWSNLLSAISRSSSSSNGEEFGFDLVLAAEVTYNPSSYAALAEAIADLLRPPHAKKSAALVAAKRHYFGVGGNVDGFCRAVEATGKLRAQRVAEVVDGPLARDVLLLTRIR